MGFERKDEGHHHTGRRGVSVDAHYDMLRSAGYDRQKARDWAERATDKFLASKDDAPSSPKGAPSTSQRLRLRVPFPWERTG